MAEVCCVDGCVGSKDEITFFKFPNSRVMRRKWVDAIPSISIKVTLDTLICSHHFLPEQYDLVRGKKRLKSKVVPSVFHLIPNSPNEDKAEDDGNFKSDRIPIDSVTTEHTVSHKSTDNDTDAVPQVTTDNDTDVKLPKTADNHTDAKFPETTDNHTDAKFPESTDNNTDAKLPETTDNHTDAKFPESTDNNTDAKLTETTDKDTDVICQETADTDYNTDAARQVTTDNTTDAQKSNSANHRRENETEKLGDFIETTQLDNISISDSETGKDIEDIITGYQIKQTRPVHQHMDTRTHFAEVLVTETEIGRNREIESAINYGTEDIIDLDNVVEPVFIEVSVGKGGSVQEAINQDCMMLLESVQCEVDPSSLIYHDPNPGYHPNPGVSFGPGDNLDHDPGEDSDVIEIDEKKEDPISLLTSSDEDEVIIQEPHYDMVEVSDETDEDDMPLVKLVQPASTAKVTKTKKSTNLTKILWGKLYEYYCVECHFKSTSKSEYKRHLKEHTTVIQVCELCSYTTSSKQQYYRHKRKHKGEKAFKCHLCKYKARHNMSLIYHMKTHENGHTPDKSGVFNCEKCKFTTRVKSDLLKHLRKCGAVNRFSCSVCRYETNRRSDMVRHKDRKHGELFHENDDDYMSN